MIFNKKFDTTSLVSLAWILAIIVAGVGVGVASPMGWLVVCVLAIGPAAMLLHLLKAPRVTTSEAIQHARR